MDCLDLCQELENHEGFIYNGKTNPLVDSGLWVPVTAQNDKLIALLEMLAPPKANSEHDYQNVQQTSVKMASKQAKQQRRSVVSVNANPQIPISILIAYAYRDKRHVEEIEQIVRIMSMQDQNIAYQMCEVATNMEWRTENHLDSCHLVLLFVTRNFLETTYCYSPELKRAVQKHIKHEVRLLPIHYDKRATPLLPGTPFGGIMMTPQGGKAVTDWSNRDAAMKNVTIDIQKAVKDLQVRR